MNNSLPHGYYEFNLADPAICPFVHWRRTEGGWICQLLCNPSQGQLKFDMVMPVNNQGEEGQDGS